MNGAQRMACTEGALTYNTSDIIETHCDVAGLPQVSNVAAVLVEMQRYAYAYKRTASTTQVTVHVNALFRTVCQL